MGGPEGTAPGWRVLARVDAQRFTPPDWLTIARNRTRDRSFQASARDITALAENLSGLRINVLLEGNPIREEGLAVRLGKTSKPEAFRLLIGVADNGHQKNPLTIDFEDVVVFDKRGKPIDTNVLGEIHEARRICTELAQSGAIITGAYNLSRDTPLHELPADKIDDTFFAFAYLLKERAPSSVLSEWARDGWPCYNNAPGTYWLGDVIKLVVG